MVFSNIVRQCITQIRQGLWPRIVLREITAPLPFLAYWVSPVCLCLTGITKRKVNILSQILLYNSGTKSKGLVLQETRWGKECPHSVSHLNQEQALARSWALKQWAGFANHISNEQWDTIREISVWKQHLGLPEWECKSVLRNAGLLTWWLDTVKCALMLSLLYQNHTPTMSPLQLLSRSHLLDFVFFR